jgi:hypothetical protein
VKHPPIIVLILLLTCSGLRAQFFQKVDDDFKFNGVNLARFRNENSLKGCTFLGHTEWGNIYQPPKDEIKTKKFTLSHIRYYTDLTEPVDYVYLITAVCTGDFLEQSALLADMSSGAKSKTNIGAEGQERYMYQHMRSLDYYQRVKDKDSIIVYILVGVTYDAPGFFTKTHPFISYLGKSPATDPELRNYLFYSGPADKSYRTADSVKNTYYALGTEAVLQHDTLVRYTVYNQYKSFMGYSTAPVSYVSLNDNRAKVNGEMGTPAGCNINQSVCLYHRYDVDVTVSYANKISGAPMNDADAILSIAFSTRK